MSLLPNNHEARIKKVASKLKQLREQKGYRSAEAFAYDHNLPRVQYWRMEKGTNFRFTTFLNVLDKHKTSLEDFFSGLR